MKCEARAPAVSQEGREMSRRTEKQERKDGVILKNQGNRTVSQLWN